MAGLDVEQYLAADHALLGPPTQVAAALATDPALTGITDLLVSFVPGVPEPDEHRRLLVAAARDVAGALGWRPAGTVEPTRSAADTRPHSVDPKPAEPEGALV